ncbi:MAG: hypothetical protein HQM04_16675 [Magnetococcales bacterium]|nr:hypothetical protein [Magnetococcales bacterium]MBF0116665.1 hypothetical protein [Magnetococcales bacterium]
MPVSTLRIPFAFPDGGIVINARMIVGPDYEETQQNFMYWTTITRTYYFTANIEFTNLTKVTLQPLVQYRYYNIDTIKTIVLGPGETVTDQLRVLGMDSSREYNNPYVATSDKRNASEGKWQNDLSIAVINGPSVSLPLSIGAVSNGPEASGGFDTTYHKVKEDISELGESNRTTEQTPENYGDVPAMYVSSIDLTTLANRGRINWEQVPPEFREPLKMKLKFDKPLFPPQKDPLGAKFEPIAPFTEVDRRVSAVTVPVTALSNLEGYVTVKLTSQITLQSSDGSRKLVLNFNPSV